MLVLLFVLEEKGVPHILSFDYTKQKETSLIQDRTGTEATGGVNRTYGLLEARRY